MYPRALHVQVPRRIGGPGRRGALVGGLTIAASLLLQVQTPLAGHAVAARPVVVPPSPLASRPVQVINDNAAWCWFQGDRSIITSTGDLLVGSTPSTSGVDGAARGGAVEVTRVRASTLAAPKVDRLHPALSAGGYRSDDHVNPALLELPTGRVVASWAGHNDDMWKHSGWIDPGDHSWTVSGSSARNMSTTYSNLFRVPSENGGRGRLYDFYRGELQGVNAVVSDDEGQTWRYAGTLVKNTPRHPYTRFTQQGNRLFFVSSAANPQMTRGTAVRSGFLEGGRIYSTSGQLLGSLAGGGVDWNLLTTVRLGVVANEGADVDVWTSDMAMVGGRPTALLTVKHPTAPAVSGRHFTQEYLHARWNGSSWIVNRIGWGGSELYHGQPSYSGNLTFDRANPNRVFLSSNVAPDTGAALISTADGRSHWEVYEATTSNSGSSWSISAVTANSSVDNLRPIHVSRGGSAVLLWMRGTYTTFRDYRTEAVAVVDRTGSFAAPPSITSSARLPGTSTRIAGAWTGGADGLFTVGSEPGSSGFHLPNGRGRKASFIHVPLRGDHALGVGDFDGDGREQLMLIDRSGAGNHKVVSLRSGNRVETVTRTGPRDAVPVIGDFDGDHRSDILWYGRGLAPDRLDLAGSPARAISVVGWFSPVVGDFDGNGRDDIFWYAPGAGRDHVWHASSQGHFVPSEVSASGVYRPMVIDQDGDGDDDIILQSGSLRARSYLWRASGRHFASSSRASTLTLAVGGDFDGDGRDDLFFDRPGARPDSWWWGAMTFP